MTKEAQSDEDIRKIIGEILCKPSNMTPEEKIEHKRIFSERLKDACAKKHALNRSQQRNIK